MNGIGNSVSDSEYLKNSFGKYSTEIRREFIDNLLVLCNPDDLMYLNKRLDEFKRDFICLLPIEVTEIILGYLDYKSLLNCCQVNSNWNQKISKNFNKIWYRQCIDLLPLDRSLKQDYESDPHMINYKDIFVDLLRKTNDLESGRIFLASKAGPAEINAIASYKNIIATATHIVKFWKLSKPKTCLNTNCEWICFNSITLKTRASNFKFDDKHLIACSYFLTIDLYCMKNNQFLYQYIGHTCSISCFDYNNDLMLIATGSADNTIKFWSMNLVDDWDQNKNMSSLLIKTQDNLVWPVRIVIENYSEVNWYLVMVICANGFLHLNLIEKIQEFIREDESVVENNFDVFNFKFNLKISDTFKAHFNLQSFSENHSNDEPDIFQDQSENVVLSNKSWVFFEPSTNLLTVFLIAENNYNQIKKMSIKQWSLSKNIEYDILELNSEYVDERLFDFLNRRSIKSHDINQYEIVTFGFNFCIFLDDLNNFYISNLKTKTIKCIQDELKFDRKTTKAFRLLSNNTQEQFIFNDRKWLNGFRPDKLNNELRDLTDSIAFTFFTQKRNEAFIVEWKN